MVPKPQDACALPRKKANMGRPRKSEPRDRQLNVSLTATEYESIVRRANALAMRPVHFSRALLLNSNSAAASTQRTPSNIERLNYSALVRLGNNLNQMMRHLHSTGEPVPTDLEPLLTDIRQILAREVSK
jgi:hypothetical protein